MRKIDLQILAETETYKKITELENTIKIDQEKIEKLHKSIHKVLDDETKALGEAIPESYTIELRDFLKIHHHGLDKSPTGYEIKTEKNEGRNTYFTDEQELFN